MLKAVNLLDELPALRHSVDVRALRGDCFRGLGCVGGGGLLLLYGSLHQQKALQHDSGVLPAPILTPMPSSALVTEDKL